MQKPNGESKASPGSKAAAAVEASSEADAQQLQEEERAADRAPELTQAQVAESQRMLEALHAWRGSREGQEWQAKRRQLPVVKIQEGLLAALAEHDIVVVGGDTGCGKTTQVILQQCSCGLFT